jgi:hypothetical protein
MYVLGRILEWLGLPGLVRPFLYRDESGGVVSIRTSPRYTILSIDGKEYFFVRETGKFDGIGAMQLDPDAQPNTDCRAVYTPESVHARALS